MSGLLANLQDRASRTANVMAGEDPAAPVPVITAEPEGVHVTGPDETPASAPTLVPRSAKPKVQKFTGVMGTLVARRTAFKRNKVFLNCRIDDWIDEEINRQKRQSEEAGVSITKEMIVIQSLIQGLGLTPPEGWDIFQ